MNAPQITLSMMAFTEEVLLMNEAFVEPGQPLISALSEVELSLPLIMLDEVGPVLSISPVADRAQRIAG